MIVVSLWGTDADAQPVPAARTCTVRGQITDEDGGRIATLYALIHNDARATNQQVIVDANGRFKAGLRPGLYDLFVSSPGLMPQAQVIDLRACKPMELHLMLPLDAEHPAPEGK